MNKQMYILMMVLIASIKIFSMGDPVQKILEQKYIAAHKAQERVPHVFTAYTDQERKNEQMKNLYKAEKALFAQELISRYPLVYRISKEPSSYGGLDKDIPVIDRSGSRKPPFSQVKSMEELSEKNSCSVM